MASTPETVILALWPTAAMEKIDIVISSYRRQYPNAQIELLRSKANPSHLDSLNKMDIQPNGHVLLHIFGDEAAAQACVMLRSYYAHTGQIMDVETLILDAPPLTRSGYRWVASLCRPYQLFSSACTLMCSSTFGGSSLYGEFTWVKEDLGGSHLLPAAVKRYYLYPEGKLGMGGSESGDEEAFISPGCVEKTRKSSLQRLGSTIWSTF